MDIQARFDHFNFNVLDLERSLKFYQEALGLTEHRRKVASDGSFILVYLADKHGHFQLELTWLRDRDTAYNLGDLEYHLCMRVAEDYDKVRAYHRELGCIVYENHDMGLYFIADPDGYWIEILPEKY
ncbi:MAG: VOC family protein [Porphyromonadaceae bacterium]|nr:VOC family protein [Porphyromonadaceae bacterium]